MVNNVAERRNQEVELNAADFGLLEDENNPVASIQFGIGDLLQSTLAGHRHLDGAGLGSFLHRSMADLGGGPPTQRNVDYIRNACMSRLEALRRQNMIQSFNNLTVEGDIVSFYVQPARALEYIAIEVQI
jgi:hypothetical protein